MSVYASVFREPRPPTAVIGAGAAGRALALRLADHGYPVRAVLSRTAASAEALAALVGAPVAADRLDRLPGDVRLVVLAAPDGALAGLAETLVEKRHAWAETVVVHASGALSADVLAPLADVGATVLAFHPLQALPPGADGAALDGATVGLQGTPRAVAAGVELAAGLGLRYLVTEAEDRPRYHLAATMASNFLVTLVGMVQETLASIGLDRAQAIGVIEPLLRGTLDNLSAASPEEALTGPVVRGDLETLKRHGLALRAHLPQLVPAYAALSVETVRLAVRSGRLAPERAERVLTLMQQMVTIPLPERGGEADREPRPPAAPRPPASRPVEGV